MGRSGRWRQLFQHRWKILCTTCFGDAYSNSNCDTDVYTNSHAYSDHNTSESHTDGNSHTDAYAVIDASTITYTKNSADPEEPAHAPAAPVAPLNAWPRMPLSISVFVENFLTNISRG